MIWYCGTCGHRWSHYGLDGYISTMCRTEDCKGAPSIGVTIPEFIDVSARQPAPTEPAAPEHQAESDDGGGKG